MAKRENSYDQILAASKTVGLPVKKVFDILYYIRGAGRLENNLLVQIVGVSKNVTNQIKQSLKPLFGPVGPATMLSSEGVQITDRLIDKNYKTEESIWQFLNSDSISKISQLLSAHKSFRASPDRKFDQFTATIETTAKRAALMEFFMDIKGKKILCLGDDDFTSVGVATLCEGQQVDVLEIDPRINNSIIRVSKIEGLNIETKQYDAREPLAKQYLNQYDVVFIDPPYTPMGINLFLSRAIQALDKDNHSARIYLCYGNSDRASERFIPIYELLSESGLLIQWVFDKFNRYEGAISVGSSSTLFVCDVTPKIKPLISGKFTDKLYTFE